MANGPGYAQKPQHEVKVGPEAARLRLEVGGEVVAESAAALALSESAHGVVHYFPKADVRMAKLRPTTHSSYCPFKGTASYWSLDVGGRRLDDVVWAYEDPYDEVSAIKGHVAFWLSRIPGAKVERL